LRGKNIEVDILPVEGGRILDYARHVGKLNRFLKEKKIDIIHTYFVYSGMTAIFQAIVPVVATFIGSDFNRSELRFLAKATVCRKARKCIFMTDSMASLYKNKQKREVICFGIDFNRFYPVDRSVARQKLGWDMNKQYILFASTFSRPEKNAQLAFDALAALNDESIELVEFKKEYKYDELNLLYNASNLLLMTSLHEGSPQVIKEAMACNLPIVATDVGDVRDVMGNLRCCYLSSYSPEDVAEKIRYALFDDDCGDLRKRILSLKLDTESVTEKIINIYKEIISSMPT